MQITINYTNLDNWYESSYPEVTEIYWRAGELSDNVLQKFPNLIYLDCGWNQISSLDPLINCTSIQTLIYYSNKITSLEPLSNCINLRSLSCYSNRIRSLKPLAKCINLQSLKCLSHQIISLEPLSHCINLRYLEISSKKINFVGYISDNDMEITICQDLEHRGGILSLEPLAHCINLEYLDCSNNHIMTLKPLLYCVNLRYLDCSLNNLTSLEGISCCTNIQYMDCGWNRIQSLVPLSHYFTLQKLICSYNSEIQSLDPLSTCTNLQYLDCRRNSIKYLNPLSRCINLQHLICCYNRIISLEPLIYLRRLSTISYTENPLNPPTLQVQRFINRMKNINTETSIYNDKQNIHDINIQQTVCESIQRLLQDPKPEFNLVNFIQSPLDPHVISLIVEYLQDETIHSIHFITYCELFSYVWNRIINSPHKLDLLKILEEQIMDSECKCFTGRFNRTLSVLAGFYDDIKIEISDGTRIGAIILAAKQKIHPYNSELHKEIATKSLLEVGYSEEEIDTWINAIE